MAFCPVDASPTTCISGWLLMSVIIPSRSSGWSSTQKTRMRGGSFIYLAPSTVVHSLLLGEAENDAGAQTHVVLNTGGRVRELGADPIGLQRTHRKMPREGQIYAASDLQSEGIRTGLKSGSGRESAVQSKRDSDQCLAENIDPLLRLRGG